MTSLERRLGPLDAAAIVVSNVIGGGIFFVPILVAQLTGDARAMLFVWVAGGVLAFMGTMAYAELAALRPRSGGEYLYLREAFGSLAAFLTGDVGSRRRDHRRRRAGVFSNRRSAAAFAEGFGASAVARCASGGGKPSGERPSLG